MIVCLCNALTEAQLSDAVGKGAHRPREVYAACDCKAQCGGCTRTILGLIREMKVASGGAGMAMAGAGLP